MGDLLPAQGREKTGAYQTERKRQRDKHALEQQQDGPQTAFTL
jgi:hypothetical protein